LKITVNLSPLEVHEVVDQFIRDLDEHTLKGHFKNIAFLKRNDSDLVEVHKAFSKVVASKCALPKGFLAEEIKDV
jgi:hypothetical protein